MYVLQQNYTNPIKYVWDCDDLRKYILSFVYPVTAKKGDIIQVSDTIGDHNTFSTYCVFKIIRHNSYYDYCYCIYTYPYDTRKRQIITKEKTWCFYEILHQNIKVISNNIQILNSDT